MSLYSKLALTLFVMLVLFGLFLLHNLRSSNEMYQQEIAQKLNSRLAAHIVDEEPLISDNAVNHAALEKLFHTLMVINPSIEVYLLDPAGTIIAHAAPQERIRRMTVDLQPVRDFLAGAKVFPLTGDDPRGDERAGVFSAARIPASGPLQGYLYIILGSEQYASVVETLRDSYIFRTNSQALLVALVIALLSGLAVFALLTRRLRHLTREIGDHFDDAGTATSVETGGDEITQLDAAFRQMSKRINSQMRELEKTDNLRRELVANISHDLRTPLTTLQGYLETLALKEATLDDTDRKRYLRTAVQHCRRLTELVDELFELAKLDSCEQISYSEPFSLSELAQDIVQKYQLKANEQHVELRADCHDSVPMVHGDIGMLARVLENLVDNALRHTAAGGQVSLDLNPRGDHVVVKVADTGCGIPAEEIDHVFDRFYHAGDRDEHGDQHAGLGLAIVRRILELHGSRIEVLSAEGKGTEFSFRMPVAIT